MQQAEVFGVNKVKLDIVVLDQLVEKVLQTISHHAHTGNPGDGKIFVSEVTDVMHIRTGKRRGRSVGDWFSS